MKELIDFIQNEGGQVYQGYDREELEKVIKLHKQYGTFMEIYDKEGLAAVARWDWVNNDTVHIMDVIIRKGVRGIKVLKALLFLGIKNNPQCKYIGYQRAGKYGSNRIKVYSVKEFLGR